MIDRTKDPKNATVSGGASDRGRKTYIWNGTAWVEKDKPVEWEPITGVDNLGRLPPIPTPLDPVALRAARAVNTYDTVFGPDFLDKLFGIDELMKGSGLNPPLGIYIPPEE